jgi:hypothetical protein
MDQVSVKLRAVIDGKERTVTVPKSEFDRGLTAPDMDDPRQLMQDLNDLFTLKHINREQIILLCKAVIYLYYIGDTRVRLQIS